VVIQFYVPALIVFIVLFFVVKDVIRMTPEMTALRASVDAYKSEVANIVNKVAILQATVTAPDANLDEIRKLTSELAAETAALYASQNPPTA
jgi:hypothetical protein